MLKEISGYSLFLDIKDPRMRIKNQSRVLFNILEDNRDEASGLIKSKGKRLSNKYFGQIHADERQEVYEGLEKLLKDAGYVHVTN